MSPQIIEYSHEFAVEDEFPNCRLAREGDGVRLWRAERDGSFYIIFDERGTADVVLTSGESEEPFRVRPNPVNVITYQSEGAREAGVRRLFDALNHLPQEHRLDEGNEGGATMRRSPKPLLGGPENARRFEDVDAPPRSP